MNFTGETISWKSRLQKCVSLYITEVEYIVQTETSKKLSLMKKFLQELDV